MHTHSDASHFMNSLKEKMDRMTKEKKNLIAGPEEEPLGSWKARNGMYVSHMPDDEHGLLRISVGGGDDIPVTMNYCTIRGGVGQCIAMLEMAIAALRESPE